MFKFIQMTIQLPLSFDKNKRNKQNKSRNSNFFHCRLDISLECRSRLFENVRLSFSFSSSDSDESINTWSEKLRLFLFMLYDLIKQMRASMSFDAHVYLYILLNTMFEAN